MKDLDDRKFLLFHRQYEWDLGCWKREINNYNEIELFGSEILKSKSGYFRVYFGPESYLDPRLLLRLLRTPVYEFYFL